MTHFVKFFVTLFIITWFGIYNNPVKDGPHTYVIKEKCTAYILYRKMIIDDNFVHDL